MMIAAFFAGFFLFYQDNRSSNFILLVGAVMFVQRFFLYNRAELMLSRLTHDTATGGSSTRREARSEVASLKSQTRTVGLSDMAAA